MLFRSVSQSRYLVAYTRIKEYYDFYAVPLRLISRALPQAFTQMTDYMTSAASGSQNTTALSSVPYTTMAQFNNLLLVANTSDQPNTRDDAGLPYVYGACKLLDLLGYGSMIDKANTSKAAITQKYLGLSNISDGDNPLVYSTSQAVNMLPLLAYQKIYFDFFSNSQWEKHLAYAYNVDYWAGTSYITLYSDMLKMRYANYPKDYFMGILPSSQYGSVALLPSTYRADVPSNSLLKTAQGLVVKSQASGNSVVLDGSSDSVEYVRLNSNLSALSIRATEYLQRWKEVEIGRAHV